MGTSFDRDVATSYVLLRVVLRGTRTAPVRIAAIGAKTVARSAPLAGGVLFAPPQGETPAVALALPLDTVSPEARVPDEYSGLATAVPYVRAKQLTIARDESITLQILAHSRDHAVDWMLSIVPEGEAEVLVENKGRSWRVPGIADNYMANYDYDFAAANFVQVSHRPW